MGAIAEIEGKLIRISKEVTSEKSTFKYREIEIYVPNERDSKYDDYHEIQVKTNNYELIDKFKVGSHVKATVNLIGKPWTNATGKRTVFKTYSLWKLELVGAENAPPRGTGLTQKAEDVGFVSDSTTDENEKLPF